MTDTLQDFLTLYRDAGWMAQVFTIVAIVVVVNFTLRALLLAIQRRTEDSNNHWDDAVLFAVGPPLRLLVWVVGLGFAIELLGGSEQPSVLLEYVPTARLAGLILILGWFLMRVVTGVETSIIESRGDGLDHTTVDALSKLARITIAITIGLVLLQTLGVSISGVLAFGGVGGIAVGFAAKDMLANFFGGLTIYLDRPFSVGDWVRSPDRDMEGVVEKIGWRSTVIRSFDKRPLYVPNSVFVNIIVQNPSRMSNRRIYETIGVRYDDNARLDRILKETRRLLESHPGIDTDQTIMVNFNAFGASSLDFFIYCLTRTTDWAEYHALKEEILMRVHEIIDGHGAEVAFPSRTLYLPNGVALSRSAEEASDGD